MKNWKINRLWMTVCFFWIGFSSTVQAQINGNEWIRNSQQYFKIPVAQTGIYRITQTQLTNAGITGVNPRHIQLFHRGIEQAIFIQGEEDNTLDSGDYIEFYGTRNDGLQDQELYRSSDLHLNPHYNLYSDTTAYFLTWKTDGTFGKRMTLQDISFNNAVESYHWQEELRVFSESFSSGQNYRLGSDEQLYQSQFDTGEGWGSANINANTSRNFTVSGIQNLVTNAPNIKPKLEIVVAGTVEPNDYTVEIRVGNSTGSLRLIDKVTRFSHASAKIIKTLELSDVQGTGNFVVQVRPTAGSVMVVYFKLSYPQAYTMDGQNSKFFRLPTKNTGISHLEINNPPANAIVYDITNRNNLAIFKSSVSNGKLTTSIDNTNAIEKNLFVRNTTAFLSPIALEPVTFQNINPATQNYLIITHKNLRKPVGPHSDPVQAYANYRASVAGGNFTTLIVDIDVLYNQFGYGEKTPLAIRRFARYMFQNGNPKYIFIIGKGVTLPDRYNTFNGVGINIRQKPSDYALDLIPSYGFPPSDIALVNGLANDKATAPSIPIGRIAAITPKHVWDYLDKVIEHEQVEPALWQKNIIQLTGGNTEFEQVTFAGFSTQFQNIAQGDCLRGLVSKARKSTTSAVELINISEQVNNGVGLVMFFGHSSLNVTDLEIGYASDDIQGYRNKGKYPLLLANGCQLAGIFYNDITLTQDWVLTRDRGAVGCVSHCYFGYSNPLRDYTFNFYRRAFQDENFIGKPIGDIIKGHISKTITTSSPVGDITTAEQMILQGDPFVRFIKIDKPDYEVRDNQMFLSSFDNSRVTAQSDSFKLNIIVSNIGIFCKAKPYKVQVKRIYSNGSISTSNGTVLYPAIAYQDTISFTIRREEALNGYGNNRFEVWIDYENATDEYRENNNLAVFEVFIPTIGVIPVLPTEYAIANEQPVLLTALATNQIDEGRAFIFEIDTTRTYNSPFKKSTIVTSGITADWAVNLLTDNAQDSTVYYWRVNYADALSDPTALWGESSFVYIKNSPEGWSQSHFPQFSRASLDQIKRNDIQRKWEFATINRRIEVNTYGSTNGGNYITDISMLFDGVQLVFDGRCNVLPGQPYRDHLIAIAFDQNTGLPYLVVNGNQCGREPEVANYYSNAQLSSNALLSYLSLVKNGDWVLFFTAGNIQFSDWTNTMKNAFSIIGGNPTIYNTLKNGHPYIILGRKGSPPNSATEAIASTISNSTADAINLSTDIKIQLNQGTITSTRIGPAQKWKELIHDIRKSAGDSYTLDVYGINFQGQITPTPLINQVSNNQLDLSSIDAAQFPYLQLKLHLQDALNKTPAQLRKWLVIYDGVPEGLVDVNAVGQANYNLPKKLEGEGFELEFAFKNISGLTFEKDSLEVEYTLTNLNTLNQINQKAKIKAPAPKETIKFKGNFTTLNMGGKNELKLFVNPQKVPEVYYENNVLIVPFEVLPDKSNPILEVAIDGRKITNGEIVSPNPMINVALRDENRYLIPEDPSKMIVELKKPCEGCPFKAYDFSQPNVTWSVENALLQINIQEQNLPDGIYTLRAQGQDRSGNTAGSIPYQIDFEVVSKSSVTNVFPYPNPFSTNTRFVFTLTGGQIPDEMKIQIMTVSGKVVREITQDEIGAIRSGNNITEYAWDGTDEFGDKLANGVYLYRVLMKINGQFIEHRATSADRGFKNGFGKLYIAR